MAEDQTRPIINPTQPAKTWRQRRTFRAVSLLVLSLLLIAIIALILAMTVFNVKEPLITVNKITLDPIRPGPIIDQLGSNVSLTADVSVKNPNSVALKFSKAPTSVFYKGILVGETDGPSGRARAHRTIQLNISIEIVTDRVMDSPALASDIGSGLISMNTYTRVPGWIKVTVVRKEVIVEMNCTFSFNITSEEIQGQNCKKHVYIKF